VTRIIDARLPQTEPAKTKPRRSVFSTKPQVQIRELSGPQLLRVLGAVALLTLFALMLLDWKVGSIRIENSTAADRSRLQASLAPFLGQSLAFVDTEAMTRRLRRDPWVREVHVRRRPPQTVVLSVQEIEPMFRLADGGAIDTRGVRMPPRPQVDLSALPLLQCRRYDKPQRAQLLALRQALAEVPWSLNAPLDRVVLDARGITLYDAAGVQIALGQRDFAARLLRLAQARSRLNARQGDRLDLRFADQIVQAHADGVRGG
jgi:cell division septal protein FtsQ